MAVLYNVEPFKAMKILYQGETDGFPEEDFTRNEKERNIVRLYDGEQAFGQRTYAPPEHNDAACVSIR